MASTQRKSPKSAKTLVYFFLNGELHKRLHVNRGRDEITAWNYPRKKRVVLSYAQTRKDYRPAYNMQQVSKMLSRGRLSIQRAIMNGDIEEPQYTYVLATGKKFQYFWQEEDIMDAHAYFSSVHRGRPRKDGRITPQHLPTPRELRAMIRQEEILYVKEGDDFVPTWAATDL